MSSVSVKLSIKSLVELNLFTESGLAKVAIGIKLEGISPAITEEDRKYKYTCFNRGESELFNWNEDFNYNLIGLKLETLHYDKELESGEIENEIKNIYVKFRVVEEGPKAVITVPYDSRSASPVYEIIPEKQHRSIIAYGRIPMNLNEEEVFRRVDLFEVASDEKCGQLAIGIRLYEVSEIHNNNNNDNITILELNHPQPVNVKTNIKLLNIPRIVSASTSTLSEQAVESSVVLNELETEEIEVTEASEFNNSNSTSFSKINNTNANSKEDILSVNIRSNSPVLSIKSKSSSRSSLAEDSDVQDEQELTEQMKIYNQHLYNIASQSHSQSTTTTTQNSDRFDDIVGLLSLEIVAAQRLPKEKRFLRSSGYCSNPFVTISFGKKSFRTKVKTNTTNPIWKEKLAFSVRVTEMNYQVMFSVYDYESFGYNSCLATANIRTGHFIQNPEQVLKLAIPLNLSKQSPSSSTIENANSCCLLIRGSFLPYEKVRKNFWTKLLKAFDLNHNGFLCKLEFETMLESLGSTFSDSTIAKVFEAVEVTENQEISIEEAVKVLEDLTVHPPNSVSVVSEEEEKEEAEKIVILSHCPFCMKRWGAKQEEIDVITHLGICTASNNSKDQTQLDKFVMGGFLTEEYASRKWFARFLSFMSFGNYRIGRNNGNILVQDRRTGKLLEEKMPTYIRLGIRILHQNIVTYRTAIDFGYVRNIFQSLTIQQGKKFDHPSSVNNIPNFIKYHKLPVHEISDPLTSFKSFNEFFYRRIKLVEYRPLASPEDPFVTVSPADCRLNVFESFNEATKLWIKGINFNLMTLLKDEELAKYFEGGSLVIARLAPQDYHRYHSPVDGVVVMNYHIPGTYYTVNPMAVRQKVDVYTENARTITIIDSPQFGKVAYVSIGAMMVGSIKITPEIGSEVKRLSEIGYFAFGGSTIVLLYSKEACVEFDQDLLKNSRESLETLVKVGESMGRKSGGIEGYMTVTTSPPGRNNIYFDNNNSKSTTSNSNSNLNSTSNANANACDIDNSLSSYKLLNSHSPSTSQLNSPPGMKISPTLIAIRARISTEWKDLVYREALRMTGALRQIQSNNRSQLVITKKFLEQFNNLLRELKRPHGLDGNDSDLHGLSTDFEHLLKPWIDIFQSEDLTGPFIHSALISIRSFLHSGLFTDHNSPLSRTFIHDLVFSLAHSRFEPTILENDEIVMLELIEFLAELVQVTIGAIKSQNYSQNSMQNEELIGETFIFQLFDLLFVLLNQNRFSELLRAKSVEIVVEQCSLLFSCLKRISSSIVNVDNDNNKEKKDVRVNTIHFPNIVKPHKPVTPIIILNRSGLVPLMFPKIVQNNSENGGNVNLIENEVITDINQIQNDPSIDNNKNNNNNINNNNYIPALYNPFNDENENDLAPDAVEEVMKFRAKMAGISLESEVDNQEPIFDLMTDRISPHCLKEIILFLIRCLDIIDAPGKKPPGSLKASDSTSISTKVIPSVKTQMAAMKCLIAIFTDPISDLSNRMSPKNVNNFEMELIGLIGENLLKQLMAIMALDFSSRHLPSLNQLFLIIFKNYRSFFPAQFEYFISTCLGIISSKPGNSGYNGPSKAIPRPVLTALKTTCLEMLAYFLQDPSFISQIFVYYECSMDYQNTLESLTKGVAAGMEKSSGNEEITMLSGEILCNFIKSIEASLSRVHSNEEIEDLKNLLDQRRIKMIYSEASTIFNSNPKGSFPFLQEKGLLPADTSPTPKEIANFLRIAQGLDKKILGEYLVKPNHIEILREFFSAFKFSESTSIDSALRQVLESFRLPGEAQQIDRIMECFAEIFYPSAMATFTSQDACYILAFSTLMLNTDLHNPQVKHKMSLPDFIRNNRGINDGKDVPEDYLGQLYNSIKSREIVMPEEHGGEEAFASQWNEVQKRAASMEIIEYEGIPLSPLVRGIVEIVWKPIITSLIPYINQQRPTGEQISDGPLEALRGIASLFEKFQMTDALEALLGNIWSVSNLIPVFSASSGNMIPRYLARLPGFRQVVQLIVEIFRDQGDGLRNSWANWCRLMIILSESGLISMESVVNREGILFDSRYEAVSLMMLMKMAHEGRQVTPVGKQSFMSSISRFFVSNNNTEDSINTNNAPNTNANTSTQASDEVTVAARQFVGQLPFLEVLRTSIPSIGTQAFSACIESFCSHLKWNLAAGAGSGKRMSPASSAGLNWTEETLILLNESLVTIGLSVEPERLDKEVFPSAFDSFTRLILKDPCPPVKLCEHVIVGLGRLILRLSETGRLSIEKFVGYLKFWCQLSPQLQGLTLEPSLAIIGLTFSKLPECNNDKEIWPPLFTILSTASKFESSSPYTLKILQLIYKGNSKGVLRFPVDFFTEYADLLSASVIGCSELNYESRVLDPWRFGVELTRGQLAEEAISLYEQVNLFLFDDNDENENNLNDDRNFDNWKNLIVPLQSNLSRHAPLHPVKTIRQKSINLLSRLLPHVPKSSSLNPVTPIVFSRILIPLLVDLRIRQADSDEIVMRSASLTCKTFLSNLNDLGMSPGQLWKEILEAMLPLLLIGKPSEMLREGVLESCKNVLLVMHGIDELKDDKDIWRVSEVLLASLIPGWKIEIEMRSSGVGIFENEREREREIKEDVDEVEDTVVPLDLVSDTLKFDNFNVSEINEPEIVSIKDNINVNDNNNDNDNVIKIVKDKDNFSDDLIKDSFERNNENNNFIIEQHNQTQTQTEVEDFESTIIINQETTTTFDKNINFSNDNLITDLSDLNLNQTEKYTISDSASNNNSNTSNYSFNV